jgi:spore coat protein U domain-containing protein, fimbrial subunit CupE1/2/3/6
MMPAPLHTRILFCLAFAGALGVPMGPASAQTCTLDMADVSFGTVDLLTGTAYDTAADFTASCQGLPNLTVRVCPNFSAGSGGVDPSGQPRYMASGANKLAYNLFQDSGRTVVWGSYTGSLAFLTAPTVDVALNASGKGTATRTVYARIFANQPTVPSGAYLSSFAGTETSVTYSYLGVLGCIALLNINLTQVPFNVTALVAPSCNVSATTLNFGLASGLSSAIDGVSTLTVTCSTGTPFSIALNGGNAAAVDPVQRRMSKGGEQVTYGLYQDAARALPWGETVGVNILSGVGDGSGQAVTVYGRVPAQATPSPGTYTDTIIVTLTY